MITVAIGVKTLEHFDPSLSLPFYATKGAAGADICVCLPDRDETVFLPWQRLAVPTGVSLEIPSGMEIQIRPRSGFSLNGPFSVVNAPGTIDSDYRGELKIILGNYSNETAVLQHGTRVAQLVVSSVYQGVFHVRQKLTKTERGHGGFGHSGTGLEV